MRKILGIARYTFIEIFRNKVYYVLLLFAALLIVSAPLLGALGGEQRSRMMVDLGLAGIELFALIIAVFAAVTLVLEEMESRTLYLILTRPVARYQFVFGRFVGLWILITVTLFLMAVGHLLLLLVEKIPVHGHYALSLFYSWEKITLITALTMAFSLFSTSTVSAVSFSLFFWVLGHLSSEIRFLTTKVTHPAWRWFLDIFYYAAPNFQLMNLHDLSRPTVAGMGWLWPAFGYGLTYTAICLGIVVFLFRKKEF
jgi:ABC-type transport system involved in multi-copper enzyme maturation permease subunit